MRFPTALLCLVPGCFAFAMLEACGGSTTSASPAVDAGEDAGGLPEGGGDSAGAMGGDAGLDEASNSYPAPHPPMPRVVKGPGAVMRAQKIVPIVFANDSYKADITTFLSEIGPSAYWAANTTEYGAGPASSAPIVEVTDAPPAMIDDTAVGPWLVQKIAAHVLPASDPNTLYVVYYPASTVVTLQGTTSCTRTGFGGYHNDASGSTASFSYAVVPRCAGQNGLSALAEVTAASSHELLEAATDPLPYSAPAYGQVDDDHLIWELVLGGGEIGDLCAQDPRAFYKPQGMNYTVQRSWSNKSAAASHDPCVPNLPARTSTQPPC